MKTIRHATVIGSGIMGSQIAAHLASCGIPVVLLDIPSESGGRNALADKAKAGLRKLKPSPFYSEEALGLIRTGNVEDDLARAGETDLVIEAIVEKPQPKVDLFARLEPLLSKTAILATNTSGLPLEVLGAKLPAALQERFVGLHFFNPPRYLRLVEVIRHPRTRDETVARVEHLLLAVLGKTPVAAKDRPAFIANRIGIAAMAATFKLARAAGLSVEEVDALTGPLLGRPKTATFKLADLVGIDILGHLLQNLKEALPGEDFEIGPAVQTLIQKKALGRKTGAGFYRKAAKEGFEVFDFACGEYRPEAKARFEELKALYKEDDLGKRLRGLFAAEGRGARAARGFLVQSILYSARVLPEVAFSPADVDEAMELGFGWEAGPFRILDLLGLPLLEKGAKEAGLEVPSWLRGGSTAGATAASASGSPATGPGAGSAPPAASPGEDGVYAVRNGAIHLLHADGKRRPFTPRGIDLRLLRRLQKPVQHNSDASVWELRDGILLLEFHSKMNSAGPLTLDSILKAVDLASERGTGLVIGNQGPHFCAGANIAMLLLDAANGEFDNIDYAIRQFQRGSMAIKYAPVPVVVSPHNMALGGGCEFVLHSQRPLLSAETYLGLVEVGVGLLPAGGGTKEMVLRTAAEPKGIALNRLARCFELIAMAKVSTSAREAFDLGYLDSRAAVAANEATRLDQARDLALALLRGGYRPPAPALQVPVLGTESLAAFKTAIYLMREAGFASAHDEIISMAVGRILSGGDVVPGTVVSEEYLLDLEREEFLKLTGMKKTQERIEHMLKKGKPLRN